MLSLQAQSNVAALSSHGAVMRLFSRCRPSHSPRETTVWFGRSRGPARVVMALGLAMGSAPAVLAQTRVDLKLRQSDIDKGRPACNITRVRNHADAKALASDMLVVSTYEDDSLLKPVELSTALRVIIFGVTTHMINPGSGKKADTLLLDAFALNDRTVTVRRFDSDSTLCAEVANPLARLPTRTALRTTAFVAEGNVSSALRTSDSQGSATGALGIDHLDLKPENQESYLFVFGRLPWVGVLKKRKDVRGRKGLSGLKRLHGTSLRLPRLKGERLKAIITLASTVDTLRDSVPAAIFRRSVLVPALSGRGTLGGASIDYHRFAKLFDGSHGPRLNYTFANTNWNVFFKDSNGKQDSIAENLTINSFDARWRLTFIEQTRDPDGNDFAFAVEFGWTVRWLAGDGASNSEFLVEAIGTTKTRFNGPAGAVMIQLRQVTAFVDLPSILNKKHDEKLKGIGGLQPLIAINVEAPLFIFSGQPREPSGNGSP